MTKLCGCVDVVVVLVVVLAVACSLQNAAMAVASP